MQEHSKIIKIQVCLSQDPQGGSGPMLIEFLQRNKYPPVKYKKSLKNHLAKRADTYQEAPSDDVDLSLFKS